MFWTLADNIPLEDLPDILDGINAPRHDEVGYDRRSWEVGSFYAHILVRAWRTLDAFDAGRALNWLRKRMVFRGGQGESHARDLRPAMRETPGRLRAMADYFFSTLIVDQKSWFSFMRFREAILFELSTDTLLIVLEHMEVAEDGFEKQLFLYEAALSLSYQAEQPHAGAVFEKLFALADTKTFLGEVRARLVAARLPDVYFDGRSRHVVEAEESRERQRQEFDQNEEKIRTRAHLGWITHLGRIYFALYSDVDLSLAPRQRLAAWLGEARVETALAGLRAALSRSDIPTFMDVMALTGNHQHYDWWHALVAGLNERRAVKPGFDGLSDDFLKALVVFDLANSMCIVQDRTQDWLVHPWKEALLDQRPELVRDAYIAVVRARLAKNQPHAEGLHELLSEARFEPYRQDIALQLLRDFPNVDPFQLADLLDAAIKLPDAHAELLELAGRILSGVIVVDERRREMWLVTAYLLAPSLYESDKKGRSRFRCSNSWPT